MYLKKQARPRTVALADGSIMTQADLPPETTRRWVASRKAAVVKGVAAGLLSMEEAVARYDLSEEELMSWQSAVKEFGVNALKATSVQKYRQP
jgi:hypothetical protein